MRWFCLFAALYTAPGWCQETSKPPALGVAKVGQPPAVSDKVRAAAIERWGDEIKKLEALDAQEPDPQDAVLFVGSSSIRRWDDIEIDMAPYHPIRRGYGGAKYSDVAVFAARLLQPHQYRALVLFVGNDVTGKPDDPEPGQVERWVRSIISVSHEHQPQSPVFLIEVTPTEKRFAAWPRIRAVNASLREVALSTPDTYFIATAGQFLDPKGHPRDEFFVDDRLHLNGAGYDLWSELIRRRLDEVFRMTEEVRALGHSTVETASK